MSTADRGTVVQFLTAIYGDTSGYMCTASIDRTNLDAKGKPKFREQFFAYPAGIESTFSWLNSEVAYGRDVYVCAHLLSSQQRKKMNALPLQALYADVDHNEIPANAPKPSVIVESSPGRLQAFWRLNQPIQPADGERLNKRIAYSVGADKSGFDLTQLLRVPGTPNCKYPDQPTVKLLYIGDETYDPEELDALLPPIPEPSSSRSKGTTDSTSSVEPPVPLNKAARARWDGVRFVKGPDGTVDRSKSLFAIACDLARAGASEPIITEALAERDKTLGWDKYTDRGDAKEQYGSIAVKALEEVDHAGAEGETGTNRGPSQATHIIHDVNGSGAVFFHDEDDEPFVTISVGGHCETCRLRSRQFRSWLTSRYYAKHIKAPGAQALQDALNTLEGVARFEGKEHAVYVRLAEHNGDIYIDLATNEWQAMKITPYEWQVVQSDSVPVKLRRPRGMLPLPLPTRGGRLSALGSLLGIDDPDALMLVTGWLVAGLRPRGPYTILDLSGEQGSGKSTRARQLRRVIDPNKVLLRAEPRDERDLAISASNGWVIGYDNLSYIPPWLSDALCRLSTGGGFGTRTLYENDEETLFDFSRPAVFTAIVEAAVRGDLLDRAITINLPSIPAEHRRSEAEIETEFAEAWPDILGMLLDAASTALRNLPTTTLERLPRMADFALWVEAAAPALGWRSGEFLAAYERNREAASDLAMEASPIAAAVLAFMDQQPDKRWCGTATDLLQELNTGRLYSGKREQQGWPKAPHTLSGQLKRLAPNFRKLGFEVEVGIRAAGGRQRLIRIRRVCEPNDAASTTSSKESRL